MDRRLEELATNADHIRAGQNTRRVARIREYDEEIERLRAVVREAEQAIESMKPWPGDFIRRHLTLACYKVIETARPELSRLEHERLTISKTVQR